MKRWLAMCLVALLLAATGASVSADHGAGGSSLSQSADVSVCGQVTISGTNAEHLDGGEPMSFAIVWSTQDGQSGLFAVPGSYTVTFDEDLNGGAVSVSYGISLGEVPDWLLPHDTAVVDTNCEVAPAPVANAGPDQTVPATSEARAQVQLDGSASANAVTYTWSLPGGGTLDGATPPPQVFTVGTHEVTLTVANSDGVTATDTVTIIVEPFVPANPIADAGDDQTVVSTNTSYADVFLDGTGSTSPDGTITAWDWSTATKPALATGETPNVTLPIGVHEITLTVTDSYLNTTTDTVTITVEAEVVVPPVASAGADQEVTSVNATDADVTLDASASTGDIESYLWSENETVIATGATPTVTLPIGTHVITLTVWDTKVRTYTDEVTVSVVLPPPSSLEVTVYCNRNPELTRVTNIGEGSVTVTEVGSRFGTPIPTDYDLAPGQTVIFRSDSGATYGTVLTTAELYADGDPDEGAIVRVSTGKGFLSKCVDVDDETDPPPSNPSLLDITLSCRTNPELTTLTNVGQRTITLVSLTTTADVGSDEPFAISAVLAPGDSITYQSGAAATVNVVDTGYIYTNLAGDDDGAVVRISTGKGFKQACPPRT